MYTRWADRFVEERFLQGDLEKQIGLSVSPLCDRDVANAAKVELALILVVVAPLVSLFCVFLESLEPDLVTAGLEVNKRALLARVTQGGEGM